MSRASAAWLSKGERLHLHHGPIDLVVEIEGRERKQAFQAAHTRFQTVLAELATELKDLRKPTDRSRCFQGAVAQRMHAATLRLSDTFITPMAAVAGAVADEILQTITGAHDVSKAGVNNGGDIAFHIAGNQHFVVAVPFGGRIEIAEPQTPRGIATSGWKGRSHSLGIADSVTVLAFNAAMADAAATMIANQVDLAGHPAIKRVPAFELSPDSDLGMRPVTDYVGTLSDEEKTDALTQGANYAGKLCSQGLIAQAILTLQGRQMVVGVRKVVSGGVQETWSFGHRQCFGQHVPGHRHP